MVSKQHVFQLISAVTSVHIKSAKQVILLLSMCRRASQSQHTTVTISVSTLLTADYNNSSIRLELWFCHRSTIWGKTIKSNWFKEWNAALQQPSVWLPIEVFHPSLQVTWYFILRTILDVLLTGLQCTCGTVCCYLTHGSCFQLYLLWTSTDCWVDFC